VHGGSSSPRIPESVADLLLAFRDALVDALGADLVGLYLLGSVAFRGFEPHAADIDFHAVVRERLTNQQQDRLAHVHATLAHRHRYGGLIDGYYLPLEKGRRAEVPKGLVGAGQGRISRGTATAGAWALEREHAHRGRVIVLHGPDPATIYPRPTWPELEAALRGERDWLVPELERAPVYCVLNLCRIAYSFETRDVAVSKLQAAEWALGTLPDRWHPLVKTALRGYAVDLPAHERDVVKRELPAFLAYVDERLPR
jgi:Aminoglycoside adenylyltransferase, C-terminal domain